MDTFIAPSSLLLDSSLESEPSTVPGNLNPSSLFLHPGLNPESSNGSGTNMEEDVFSRSFTNSNSTQAADCFKSFVPKAAESSMGQLPYEPTLNNFGPDEFFDSAYIFPNTEFNSTAMHMNGDASNLQPFTTFQPDDPIVESNFYQLPGTYQTGPWPAMPTLSSSGSTRTSTTDTFPSTSESLHSFSEAAESVIQSPPAAEDVSAEPPKQPRRRGRRRKVFSEEEKARRRALFLERNRLAASRCRSRKKSQTDHLKEELVAERQRNVKIKEELGELVTELDSLRAMYSLCERECGESKKV